MSRIWLKFWTWKFLKTGVEGVPIIHFGITIEPDSALRGSSIFSEYTMMREVSYLVCFVISFVCQLSRAIFNVLAHCFTIHSHPLWILYQYSFSGDKSLICLPIVVNKRWMIFLPRKINFISLTIKITGTVKLINCILLFGSSLMLLIIYDPNCWFSVSRNSK